MSEEAFDNVRWLIGAIARGLHARDDEGVADVLDRLSEQKIGSLDFREPEPNTLPVVQHLPQCIGEAMLLDAELAAAIAAVAEEFHWLQSSASMGEILGSEFIGNHGWTQIIGPHGFFAGNDFRLGLFLLGPRLDYPDHFHPAPELYWPLTGPASWSKGSGAFCTQQAGTIIWHPSMIMHATRTSDIPLLAVYSWTRDTSVSTKLATQ